MKNQEKELERIIEKYTELLKEEGLTSNEIKLIEGIIEDAEQCLEESKQIRELVAIKELANLFLDAKQILEEKEQF